MGFFSGRVSLVRFRVMGPGPGMFGPEHLERLEQHAIGKQREAAVDGVEIGWIAGEHILDSAFDLAKNIVNDTLHFALRIDVQRLPSDLLRAYQAVELEALAKSNPSGRPSNRQRREARENARNRLEDEARDGRFLRRKAVPILWDAQSNELLVGNASPNVLDRVQLHFERTFGQKLDLQTAGRQAYRLSEPRQIQRGIDDATPSPFVPGVSPSEIVWVTDDTSRDFLGNEFLMWLWYLLEGESDTLKLGDGSEVAVMLARTLVLECPRAQTGRETISSEGPTRLPEARRAVQSGKLPRRIGLILNRHDQQYELTLQAETLGIGGAKLPAPESTEERTRLEERVTQLRHLLETLDLLYDVFCDRRAGEEWVKELTRIQKWLQREERVRLTG